MLGINGEPRLLVEKSGTNNDEFKFDCINGAWEGKFNRGTVIVFGAPAGENMIESVEILSDNQDRLRGNYNDVFNNFHDADYVAPKIKRNEIIFDDDIPF
jgi:hypothetical protein